MALTLHYDFLNNPSITGQTVGPDLSITRLLKATMVDADGYVREVQAGEARFTGATFNHNLLTYSEVANNYTLTELTATTGQADPWGGTTGTKLTNTIVNSQHRVFINNPTSLKERNLTLSVYAKDVDAGFMQLLIYNGSGSYAQNYNLSTGALASDRTTGGGLSSVIDSGIESIGDGWYRCWVTGEFVSSGNVQLSVIESDANGAPPFFVGTVKAITVAGYQLEERLTGVNDPSTLTVTTGAAASSLTGTSTKGLLVEEARTNICLQSEDTTTTWTNFQSVDAANQTASPDGSTTADKLTDDSGGGTGAAALLQAISISTTTTYTFSCFFKADQLDWVRMGFDALAGKTNAWTYFDLTNGLEGSSGADADSAGIESYGNGWYRCWTTVTTAADGAGSLIINVAEADNDLVVDRDGTSSIFVWGAQLEAGAFPTSYIATTTASVTRNADSVLTNDVSWLNTDAGSMYIQFQSATYANTAPVIELHDKDNPLVDRMELQQVTNNTSLRILFEANNSIDTGDAVSGGQDYTANLTKAAFAWADSDRNLAVEGTVGTTDTGSAVPQNIDQLHLSPGSGGHIAEIRYYDERFDNATLQLMSTGIFPTFGLSFVREITRALVRDLVSDLVK